MHSFLQALRQSDPGQSPHGKNEGDEYDFPSRGYPDGQPEFHDTLTRGLSEVRFVWCARLVLRVYVCMQTRDAGRSFVMCFRAALARCVSWGMCFERSRNLLCVCVCVAKWVCICTCACCCAYPQATHTYMNTQIHICAGPLPSTNSPRPDATWSTSAAFPAQRTVWSILVDWSEQEFHA